MHLSRLLLAAIVVFLTACGGGGGGGGSASNAPSSAPYILASVISFPTGGAPAGFVQGTNNNTAVSVQVAAFGGAPITDAVVVVNGTSLPYSSLFQDYEGMMAVAPGASVSLSVTVAGKVYTASGTQASVYPTVSAPVPGTTWNGQGSNMVTWTGAVPGPDWVYAVGVFDSTTGALLWPGPTGIAVVQPPTTSALVPPGSLNGGTRLIVVGVSTAALIAGAESGSGLVYGGFTYVPINVTAPPPTPIPTSSPTPTPVPTPFPTPSPPTLASVSIAPGYPTLAIGASQQLSAIGTLTDGTTQDLTTRVTWASSDSTKATVGTLGLVTAVANGTSTITATVSGVAGTTLAAVYTAAAASGEWSTFQGNAAHTGFVDAAFDATKFATRWSWARPAGDPEPIGGINSVATGDGRVYVTKDIYFGQGAVYALNEGDGTLAWSAALGPLSSEGPAAYMNGSVFVPTTDQSENCSVATLAAATGVVQSRSTFGCQWSDFFAPTPLGGSVFQTAQTGAVHAFSSVGGGQQWWVNAHAGNQSTPAVDGNYVYQYGVSGPSGLYVFDRITGASVASIADPNPSTGLYDVFGAPMLGSLNDAFAFSGASFSGRAAGSSEQAYSRKLVRYDIAARTVSWVSSNTYVAHPAIANGVVYAAGTSPAQFEALSETDGHVLWSWPLPTGSAAFHRNVVVTRNLAFLSTDVSVYAVDLNTHQAVWSYPKPGMLAISGNSTLYIVTGSQLSDGGLVAIKLQ